MPPARSADTLAMSATLESSPLRRSSGSGIGHIASPARLADSETCAASASSLAMTPDVRLPRATVAAPVKVATSMSRAGVSAPERASASASTSRPSASVFSTSTVLPP